MKRPTVHVVGAGLSGLAAALRLAVSPVDVVLHEARDHAGGKRRSFHDEALGLTVDSGNFPLLGCHRAMRRLIESIGAADAWRPTAEVGASFADMASGDRWTIRPDAGRLPRWLVDKRQRPPNTSVGDLWALRRLVRAPAGATVADLAPRGGPAYERLWRPLTLAAANAEPQEASARLVGAVLADLLAAGGGGARAILPIDGFGRAFIEPALKTLRRFGVVLRFGRRLTALDVKGDRVVELEFEHDRVDLSSGDAAILAVPPQAASALVRDLAVPQAFHATVTVHFACPPPAGAPQILGLLNGAFHWLYCYRDHMSATILDAGERAGAPRETIAAQCWRDVAALTGLSDAMPGWRVMPQRRASFVASPEQDARRPGGGTRWRNLFLAGGYVQTGLPDTIESAVRSGEAAAAQVAARLGVSPPAD